MAMRLRTLPRLAGRLLTILAVLGSTIFVASAQENPIPMGMLTSKTMLANRADVRTELKLTHEQVGEIQRRLGEMEGVSLGGSSGGGSALASFDLSTKSIFTKQQWDRLEQLWLQFEGAFTLQDYDTAERLKLSPEVREKVGLMIGEYRSWWNSEIMKVKKPGDLKKFRDTARKVCDKLRDLMDVDQKKRFIEMQGPKFRFAP